MQYTLRNVPAAVDAALRRLAKLEDKSLNEVALAALARGAGVTGTPARRRDLSGVAGTWKRDRAMDEALAAQREIDVEMWK